jgi:CCR4-NOT complex subunit CAF16
VQATHIFDGLEAWPSHVMYVAGGKLQVFEPAENIPELRQGQLLRLVERWLREEQRQRQERQAADPEHQKRQRGEGGDSGMEGLNVGAWSNGWNAGRLVSSIKHSSNAVMRM